MDNNKEQYHEIRNSSVKGIKWVGIAEIFIRIVQFITTLILARILLPEDFGIIAIALVFTQLANVLFDFGFSTALIQKKEINNLYFSTTFVIYFLSACVYTPLIIFGSSSIAVFFNNDILSRILPVLAVMFILNALKSIPYVISQRKMAFKQFSIIQICSVLAYSFTGTLIAFYDGGVWSFVFAIIAEQVVQTIFLNIYFKWIPSFRFNVSIFKELISYSSNVLGTRVISYLISNAPAFFIGKFIGAASLGYYNIAYQLIDFPVQRISKNVMRVLFPAFAKLQDDVTNYKDMYKTTVYHLLLILMPIFAGLVLVAPYLIEAFYGKNWLPAVIPLQILAATGFFRSVWTTTSVVYLSMGKPHIELKINLIFIITLIPVLILTSQYGLIELTVGISVCTCVFFILAQAKVLEIIKMKWLSLLRVNILPASGVIFFTSIVAIIHNFWFLENSIFTNLIFIIFSSVILYTVFISNFDRQILGRIIRFIRIN